MASETVLKVRDLQKSYTSGFFPKKHQVLKGLNFTIKPGMITGFLGGNGAGKTTTMKCLMGLSFPDSGEILYFDDEPIDVSVKRRVGFLPESPYFYDYLTGVEFLRFYGQISTELSRSALNDRINYLLKKVDLLHAKDRQLRGYSKGMLQKIGLAQALIHRPEFVVLDEPMSGLDPDGRFYLSEIIKEIASEGTAVFLSSHLLHDVERLCESLVVLKDGQVKFEGSTVALLDSMGSQYEIGVNTGEQIEAITTESLEDAQKKIEELLKAKKVIQYMRRKQNSLEEAFIKIGLRGQDV